MTITEKGRMEYQDASATAKDWGVSPRLVQRLCAEGRIEGARKIGGSWAVPVGARKPQDPRKGPSHTARHHRSEGTRQGGFGIGAAMPDLQDPGDTVHENRRSVDLASGVRYSDGSAPDASRSNGSRPDGAASGDAAGKTLSHLSVFSRLMPLMNTPFSLGHCEDAIAALEDPDIRRVAQAEHCYFMGRAEEAARISGELLDSADLAVRLSACLIYAYANLPLDNISRARYALTELNIALQEFAPGSSDTGRAIGAFTAYAASVLLHLPLPDDMPPADAFLPLLPPGLRSFVMYVRAHQLYLQGGYSRSLGLVEATLMMSEAVYPIPAIYLHLVAVMDCMSLKRVDDARDHLLAAWDLARPDGLIEAFGEHHGLLGGMLESVIKKEWPEEFKSIIDITYRFSAGWRRIHNPVTHETVADNLTTTEFTVSMLAARGWTNQEIARHMDISANTVKSYLSSSFRKLGISRRQDLAQYMLR